MRYLFFIFLLCSFLNAHKVNLFITEKEGILDIYSYFANGKPCKNCRVIIKNGDKIILEDKLNDSGEYLSELNFRTIDVVIDAGEGHIAQDSIELNSIKKEDIQTHKKNEEVSKYIKILFGLIAIFIFFFLLKRFKR